MGPRPLVLFTQASQEYNPADRTVINRGEVLGARLYVTASGTYEPEVPAAHVHATSVDFCAGLAGEQHYTCLRYGGFRVLW